MKRIVLAALAALALTSPALADGVKSHCTYSRYFGSTCTLTAIADPPPLTAAEIAARDAEDGKWLAFCKPVRQPDDAGVIRLHYAHEGCEFGRSE